MEVTCIIAYKICHHCAWEQHLPPDDTGKGTFTCTDILTLVPCIIQSCARLLRHPLSELHVETKNRH